MPERTSNRFASGTFYVDENYQSPRKNLLPNRVMDLAMPAAAAKGNLPSLRQEAGDARENEPIHLLV